MTATFNNSLNGKDRETLLEQCVEIVRDVVLARRATGSRSMPEALEQGALDLGITSSRAKAFFYREVLFVTREQWLALKAAAISECDARARRLQERTEAARAKRRQHELELTDAVVTQTVGEAV